MRCTAPHGPGSTEKFCEDRYLSLPNAISRFKALIDGLANVTQRQVDRARSLLRALRGKASVLHPTTDGGGRYRTAEVGGDYAGLLRLAMGKNKFGGGHGS